MEPARRTANQTNPVAFTASSGSRVPSGAIFPAGRSGHADAEHCHGNAFRPGERRGGGLPCRAIGSDEGGQVTSGQKAKAKKGVIERGKKGRWYALLEMRDPATGKRKRKWHRLRETVKGQREAETERAKL